MNYPPSKSHSRVRWPFLKLVTSAGRNAKLSILNYHRVHLSTDLINPDEVDASQFDWQMELVSNNFNVFTMSEAVELLSENQLPERSLAITFDDGYADNVDVALPILEKHALKATFFIATGYLDGGRMWNDIVIESIRNYSSNSLDLSEKDLGQYPLESWSQRHLASLEIIKRIKHLPQSDRQNLVDWIASLSHADECAELMMRSDQVVTLHRHGMEIGAHTITHPILAAIPDDQARHEIEQGKKVLEELIGDPIKIFAYPNGKPGTDYLPKHRDMVSEMGFAAAVSTHWGVSTSGTDIYQLRRFTPWDKTPGKFMLRLLRNYYYSQG